MKTLSAADLAEIDEFAVEMGILNDDDTDESASIELLIAQMEQSMSTTDALLLAETTPPAGAPDDVQTEVRALAVRLESLAQDLAALHARIS
ncbi:MAG: hypothetical protein ACSHWS_05960 [Sulfitobacter sp.]